MKASAIVAAVAVAALATALAKPGGLPDGWLQAGSARTCEGQVVPADGAPSPKAFSLACAPGTEGFSTLMQQIAGTDYAGKRVRLTAQVQGSQVGWGGLWMRADSAGQPGTAFDNMSDRPLQGSFGWRPAQVVLDIPADTTTLSFGFLLGSPGRLQATQFQLEIVTGATAVTGQSLARTLPRQAGNLTPP